MVKKNKRPPSQASYQKSTASTARKAELIKARKNRGYSTDTTPNDTPRVPSRTNSAPKRAQTYRKGTPRKGYSTETTPIPDTPREHTVITVVGGKGGSATSKKESGSKDKSPSATGICPVDDLIQQVTSSHFNQEPDGDDVEKSDAKSDAKSKASSCSEKEESANSNLPKTDNLSIQKRHSDSDISSVNSIDKAGDNDNIEHSVEKGSTVPNGKGIISNNSPPPEETSTDSDQNDTKSRKRRKFKLKLTTKRKAASTSPVRNGKCPEGVGGGEDTTSSEEEEEEDEEVVEEDCIQLVFVPMTRKMAIACLVCNIFIPGLGTMVSGLSVFWAEELAWPRRKKAIACLINSCIALAQLLLVLVVLFGWVWSIAWGVIFIDLFAREEKIQCEEVIAVPDESGQVKTPRSSNSLRQSIVNSAKSSAHRSERHSASARRSAVGSAKSSARNSIVRTPSNRVGVSNSADPSARHSAPCSRNRTPGPSGIRSATPTGIQSTTPTGIQSATPTGFRSATPSGIRSATPSGIRSATPSRIRSATLSATHVGTTDTNQSVTRSGARSATRSATKSATRSLTRSLARTSSFSARSAKYSIDEDVLEEVDVPLPTIDPSPDHPMTETENMSATSDEAPTHYAFKYSLSTDDELGSDDARTWISPRDDCKSAAAMRGPTAETPEGTVSNSDGSRRLQESHTESRTEWDMSSYNDHDPVEEHMKELQKAVAKVEAENAYTPRGCIYYVNELKSPDDEELVRSETISFVSTPAPCESNTGSDINGNGNGTERSETVGNETGTDSKTEGTTTRQGSSAQSRRKSSTVTNTPRFEFDTMSTVRKVDNMPIDDE